MEDPLMVVLRIVHIVAGVFWAGSALFLAFILVPRLAALGPEVQRSVMGALTPVMGPALTVAAVLTIGAGSWMALKLRDLDKWFDDGWGWAIFIGFVVSVAAFILGAISGMTAARLSRAGAAMEGPPSPEQMAEMQGMARRLTVLGRATAILVLIAVGSMASARWI